jgi:DNA-binding transcriptional regulator YhcF (GntR family)
MDLRLDRASPVPLYHQLAEGLRWRISTGELAPGQRLPSLRAAAVALGVNLHTVRAAYERLVDEGLLVADGARGTRVVATARPAGPTPDDLDGVVRRLAEEGRRHGLAPADLARRLQELHEDEPAAALAVVECSLAQCADHAGELEARFAVQATPWPLDRDGEPPPGPIVATYFHYGDVVRRWPRRRADVLFVAVRPDPAVAEQVASRWPAADRVLACEVDEIRAANLAADLEPLFADRGLPVEPVAGRRLDRTLDQPPRLPHCFAPRAWAALDDEVRRHEAALRVPYVIDEPSLALLSGRLPVRRQG